eukprot:m.63577 g.63577  ORF g.63577 m.63577 type:complete len:558 (+) comp9664_c1_seq1:254-1927(+)
MAVHASAVEVSLREINANLAELRREVARMSMCMDNWDKQERPENSKSRGRRKSSNHEMATPAELGGRESTTRRVLVRSGQAPQTTRTNIQDHMFKMAMKQKEKEAAKRLEQERLRSERRLKITKADRPVRAPVGVMRKLLVPWSERHIVWGLLPILPNGHSVKNVLELFVILLVVLSVALILLQSYHEFEDIRDHPELFMLQISLLAFFTGEYIVRWWAVRPAKAIPRPYSIKEYYMSKLSYTFSFMPMIDLLSILPFYIELILLETGNENALPGSALMIFRVVRVLRIFKLTRNNQTIVDFVKAMRSIASDLVVFMAVLGTCVVLISTAIFYAERNGEHADLYPNIPASMWWTVITFSSVGYGDVFPVTDAGKCVGAFAALLGVLLMNIPIAFVLISFDEVYSERKARENRMTRIVHHVFAWADRHKKVNPMKDLESSKSSAGQSPALKIYKKRELYRMKKQRSQAKRQLLEALMNPQHSSADVEKEPEVVSAQPQVPSRAAREKYLARKYVAIWRQSVAKIKEADASRRFKWIKRHSNGRIHPAQQAPQTSTSYL